MALHPPRSTLGAGSAVLLAALLAVGCERRLTPPADRGLAPSQSPSTSLSEEDSPSMTDAEQPAKGEASANLERIERTDAEWRKLLDPEAYRILRQSGTERPFSGIYEHDTRPGTFACKGCGLPLFRSDAKFDVDGATGTLSAYGYFGSKLGDQSWLLDGETGEYERVESDADGFNCHQYFMTNPSLSGRGEALKEDRVPTLSLRKGAA